MAFITRSVIAICALFATICAAQELESRVYSGVATRRQVPAPGRAEALDPRFLRHLPALWAAERNRPGKANRPIVGVRRGISLDISNAGGVRTLASGVQV